MWLLEFVKDDDPSKFVTRQGFTEYAETTEDAIVLTVLIHALQILNKPCKIRIFTKAHGVFNTRESRRFENWKAQKWLKSDAKSVKNANLWDIVAHGLEKHEWSVTEEEHSYQEYMRTEIKKWQ